MDREEAWLMVLVGFGLGSVFFGLPIIAAVLGGEDLFLIVFLTVLTCAPMSLAVHGLQFLITDV